MIAMTVWHACLVPHGPSLTARMILNKASAVRCLCSSICILLQRVLVVVPIL